ATAATSTLTAATSPPTAATSAPTGGSAPCAPPRRRPHARHAQVHQRTAAAPCLVDALGVLLHEGHVPPGVRSEPAGVVVGGAEQLRVRIAGDVVPLRAGHLAGLAADADRGVGEEPLARVGVLPPGIGGRVGCSEQLSHQRLLASSPAPGPLPAPRTGSISSLTAATLPAPGRPRPARG